ncbi:MAG: hypothetical protein A2787_04795 [Omnitrophica WOR_2 bacterium RIFCSPHIGHO2_01_FULL_48_9]|nr:MAG: hypothetical protein A3D10_03605 [Omnitrophica WOR_2 bacterium RIFCSPHIGHO2_02_FULL_48_11]OGX33237.1 MAG: hypothetical protein A2787_04795 [Omnitrophica WOR_2 bacterium RIFCSPHIGHO2_01_FULL_48_9]
MMRYVAIFDTVMIALYTLLFIMQLWNQTFSTENFFKISVTMGILVLTVTVIGLIYREFMKDKELKKDNYIG